MSADQTAIKEAFFKRSKEIHPDLHPDDPEAVNRFQQLAAAYEVNISRTFCQMFYPRYIFGRARLGPV